MTRPKNRYEFIVANNIDKYKVDLCHDKKLMAKFYELRNEIYVNENNYDHDKWTKTDHESSSEIIVVTENNKLVGGAKLSFSKNKELLSDEYEGTDSIYRKVLDRYDLDSDCGYCQIDDMVLAKEYRNGVLTKRVAEFCMVRSLENECKYIFFVASLPQCRLYKSYFTAAGCKDVIISKDTIWMKVEEYNFSEDHPAVVVIS